MLKGKLVDMHVHSDNSFDGDDPVIKMCERAEHLDFGALAITDHCEIDVFYTKKHNVSIMNSYFSCAKAKAVFEGRLAILSGVELGQPMRDLKSTEQALSIRPYDFVLGSLHKLANYEDFYYFDPQKHNGRKMLRLYFNELLEMVQWGKFDSLAHITYPLRYMIGKCDCGIEEYMPVINDILKLCAEKDIAFEINTSPLRGTLGALPKEDFELLCRFRELGGKLVTVGSDAHCAADFGAGIPFAVDLAAKAGFGSVAMFIKRQPIELAII
ncbi:MAG: histidinol-phosphatase HisJ family protein [Clostridia bacterium]|nr:histidinol-phosphatase HisJ family protein [Clostridia bacterium]